MKHSSLQKMMIIALLAGVLAALIWGRQISQWQDRLLGLETPSVSTTDKSR